MQTHNCYSGHRPENADTSTGRQRIIQENHIKRVERPWPERGYDWFCSLDEEARIEIQERGLNWRRQKVRCFHSYSWRSSSKSNLTPKKFRSKKEAWKRSSCSPLFSTRTRWNWSLIDRKIQKARRMLYFWGQIFEGA
jgi:hypothetical protein